MASKTAFLAFMADAPLIGLRQQPAYAPDPNIESFDAAGFAKALGAYDTLEEALEAVKDDHEAACEAVEDGDLDDCDDQDFVQEVVIHDDGRIEAFHDNPRYVCAEFTIAEVYSAYGMTMPSPKPEASS